MKKVLALALALMMMFSLAACGTSSSSEAAASTDTASSSSQAEAEVTNYPFPEKTVKIGMVTFDTSSDQFIAIQEYFKYLSQYVNIEMIYSESISAAEEELAFIESAAAAGCQAIIGYYNIARTESVQLTIDLGMYYYGVAEEASVYDEFKNNDKYLGGYYAENMDYESGYALGNGLVEAGAQKVVYSSGGRDFGIQMFIDRSAGFYAAIEEAQANGTDIEVVYDVSGWPGTDAYSSEQAAALDTGADAVGSSFGVATWLQPTANTGRDIKLAGVDSLVENFVAPFEAGQIVALSVEPTHIFGLALPLIINAVEGDLIRNEAGEAPRIPVERLNITSGSDYASYVAIESDGTWILNGLDMLSVIKGYDDTADYQKICDLYMAQSVEEITARRDAQK